MKARRGVASVQEPGTAPAPEMPQSALERVAVDHVVAPPELPGLLARLASEPAPGPPHTPETIGELEGSTPGSRAELVCPHRHGTLTE